MIKVNPYRLAIHIISIILILFIYSKVCAETLKLDEITTEEGKILIGLTKVEAFKKFGLPYQGSRKFWYYRSPNEFWIYFKEPPKLIAITTLPAYVDVPLEQPIMFKAIGKFSDFSSEDISDQVEWVSKNKQVAEFIDDGVVSPLAEGTTQVFAFKDGIISTISVLDVTERMKESEEQEKIELISVDALPQNPELSFHLSQLTFQALGVFKNNETGTYRIKDISDDVVWHSKDENIATFVDNLAYLGNIPGKTEIFCSKDEIVSPVQVLTLLDAAPPRVQKKELESITMLPRTVIVEKGKKTNFRAFGTFSDNTVEEITLDVDWRVKDYEIATVTDRGRLAAKKSGITEVQAVINGISSQFRKLVVLLEQTRPDKDVLTTKREEAAEPEEIKKQKKPSPSMEEIKKQKKPSPSMEEIKKQKKPSPSIDEIEEQVRTLERQMRSNLESKLQFIQIFPLNPELPLGAGLQFTARGEYTDGSYRNLTGQAEWQSSNPEVATIEGYGAVQSKSTGISFITASFEKIRSFPQTLTVVAPQLVSINITPENPTVDIDQTIQFEAQGTYTGRSTRNITAEVDWISSDQDTARFGSRGKLEPQKGGTVKVLAKYGQIKSPAQLVTIITPPITKVLLMIARRLAGLFLFTGIVFLFIMYLKHHMFIQHLKKLMRSDPRSFVIQLYNNLVDVLGLYGVGRKKSMPLGEYVSLVKDSYTDEDVDKLAIFTERFGEARYSSHTLAQDAASAAAYEYDVIIAGVMKFHRLRSNFIKYIRIVIRKLPLRVSH